LSGVTLKRLDNVGVVADDLAAAVAFFNELGLELEGEAPLRVSSSRSPRRG
jgi:catechol 2,3-dioxygenase-like lactoylglutathione lyase family enzyme